MTDGAPFPLPEDAEVINALGCLVMPGLIEAHCHMGITEEKKGMEGTTVMRRLIQSLLIFAP